MPVLKKSESPMQKVKPGFERRLAYLNDLMVAVCDFSGGPMAEPDKPHSHPHEQISYVEEGELWFFIGQEKHRLAAGDIYTVPPDIPHCIQTLTSFVRIIDTFSPIRKDLIS
jgi:quercetin dioxygenase-like cupin family protein